MAKIAEVLDIKRSYSTQVNLRAEYGDPTLREERMAHYKPIKAHRLAFERVAEGIYQQNNKRSFVISGSYGTGKSHLLLMAANYYANPSSTKDMEEFFKNYELSEEEEGIKDKKSTKLRNLRSEGRYLVSICDYASPNFETNLLRAVRETFEKEEININTLDSYYKQSADKIREWENSNNTYFITALNDILEQEDSKWTAGGLLAAIEDYDVDAVKTFIDLHKKITTTDFSYNKDNYAEIIHQMVQSKKIKDNYKGMLILFDEFDYQVDQKRFQLEQFQKFLEMCSKSLLDGFPIIFVATIHKSFLDYRSVYNAKDFTTLSDRFDEIQLKTEGIEDIIAAVVNPMKNSDLWQNEIAINQSEMIQLANDTNKHRLFDWLKAAQIKTKIIENIYPLHPAATYALIRLAGAAGSNNRSVITFFSDEKEIPGSYASFIKLNEIQPSGELNLYTTDGLCDYFALNSASGDLSDIAREHLRNYETSLRELNKIRHNDMTDILLNEPIFDRLLKVMVIFNIIGLPSNGELLKFGMNMTKTQKADSLVNVLKLACDKKIVYLNDTNNCYEFKKSDSKDISGLIRDYKSRPENLPADYMATLHEIEKEDFSFKIKKFFKDDFISPQKYNQQYLEDKRFKKTFCVLKDIENPKYFADLHASIQVEIDIKKNFEGYIVYVLCETDDEISKAIVCTKRNTFKDVIIAVPNEIAKICDLIYSLKAAYAVQNNSDFTSQDKMSLKDQAQEYDTQISKRLLFISDSRNYQAYSTNGELLKKGADDEALASLLEQIYNQKRNGFKHDELNKSHDFKDNNNALRDAVEVLLDLGADVSYRSDYGNDRGDIKYVKNVLIQSGVIYSINQNNQTVICQLNVDFTSYDKVLPALSAMLDKVNNSKGERINIQNFIKKYQREYGIGTNASLLFMAVLKRYFKDSLSFVRDVNAIGSLNVNSMEILKSILLTQEYRNTVMTYEPITKYEEELIQKLIVLFGGNSNISLDTLQHLMKQWYSGLCFVCKVPAIYDADESKNFISLCNKLDSTPIRDLCLYELKEVFGLDRDELIIDDKIGVLAEGTAKQKEIIENGFLIVRKKIFIGIAELFEQKTDELDVIDSSIKEWASTLDEAQKDVLNSLQNSDSKPIVKMISEDGNMADKLLKNVPSNMSLGEVKDWSSDKTNEYISAFARGKKHIEEDVFAVSSPIYEFAGKSIEKDSKDPKKVAVKFSGEITVFLKMGDDNQCIFITTDGTNPTSADAQREKRIGSYALKIAKDCIIKVCGMNNEGKYSNVINISCLNEDTKYEVKPLGSQQFQRIGQDGLQKNNDIKISTIVPIDAESLYLCVKSLTASMETNHEVGKKEIIAGLKKIITELEV